MARLALRIRRMEEDDLAPLARTCAQIGKQRELFEHYLREQEAGGLDALVAAAEGEPAGYVTLNWHPSYPPLAAEGVPEVQDLNVLPRFRRQGVASRLLAEVEALAQARSEWVGIGVGLHPGYNAAQPLYILRGYVPDGRGVTVRDVFAREGQTVVLNDELVLHLLKRVRPPRS
jgi:GNAT superfamily N-acetyltransferase